MNPVLFLDELARHDIELRAEEGKLRFKAPEGALTKELRETIAAHREALLDVLSGTRKEPETKTGEPSAAQKRLWFVNELQGPNCTYNIPLFLRLRGNLDKDALHAALGDLARRHESLRCAFLRGSDGPVIEYLRDLAAPWEEEDFSTLPEAKCTAKLAATAREIAEFCFDLSKAPLFVAKLVRMTAEEHLLLLNFHHIIADGWSFGIIVGELSAFYAAREAGRTPDAPPLRWRYSDYVEWQKQLRETGAMDADLAFWKDKLASAPTSSTFPPDKRRPQVQNFSGSRVPLVLDATSTTRLRAKARELGASLNHLTLAATVAVLARFANAEDLVIGLPLANRTRRELEPIIGMFVNVVPLRFSTGPAITLAELVEQAKTANTEAIAHCNLPFEKLVEVIESGRDLGMNPLFQVAYNFLPPLEISSSFGSLKVDSPDLVGDIPISKYDATFYLDEKNGALEGNIEYADALYGRETALRWANAFRRILGALMENPSATLGETCVCDAASLRKTDDALTGEMMPPRDASPWDTFAQAAANAPGRAAVEEADVTLTYSELQRKAEAISTALAEAGVTKGDRVGLFLHRSADFIASALGVIRLGAVYVPVDTAQPQERLQKIAEQAQLKAVLAEDPDSGAAILAPVLITARDAAGCTGSIPPANAAGPEDPVYMIFTSGSTGVPKGVLIPWRGLANSAGAFAHEFGMAEGERWSMISSVCFDASVFEMWSALLGGCTLAIVPEALKLEPPALRDWIVSRKITVHFCPTALAESLLDLDWPESALRIIITGGQALRKRPKAATPYKLVNAYGPTETSIVATWTIVGQEEGSGSLPPIGHPLPNVRLAVTDASGNRLPPGAPGELCIAGPGVALGYFGDHAATARSFVKFPWDASSATWYKSGDTVRLMPDGELEYVGRMDGQMKLRGYRIEAGEIERALLGVAGVKQAAVRLEGEHLAAYVETDAVLTSDAVRHALTKVLPAYMVPSHFVFLKELPRTPGGKVTLKGIPFRQNEAEQRNVAEHTLPASGMEAAVAKAWSTVLGMATPGREDNFFDLGGHSLMLVRLKERIKEETGRDIEVLELFRNPTIARQAAHLTGEEKPATPTRQSGAPSAPASDAIAVMGMAGRFPEAESVEAFWTNLTQGKDCIATFSREELLAAVVPAKLADRPNYVPANGILKDVERFDAAFFGIPDREAEIIDPQQRLLLEEAWHCFEDAGIDPFALKCRVGVYAGVSLNGYMMENVLPRREIMEGIGGWAVMLANDKDFAATRISYKLNLKGPGISVNTACSTSLTAIHQAVTALHDGQCEMALAGGSCVHNRQVDGYLYEDGGVLSKDGKCRAFDASASGMVGGNGVALVLLKPLAAAIADGDSIYAVIKGIAANNDGSDKVGFTAPGVNGQVAVIADALGRAGVDPESVGYVETHGTGTQLGDTIEVAALAENYAPLGRRKQPLYIGSVKSNVGHLDSAAGATGFIKAALSVSNKTLVPSLHFEKKNEAIHWPGEAIQVSTKTAPFAANGPVRAAVSALGIGGTNVHAILEEAPAGEPTPEDGRPHLLLLSGRTKKSLKANAASLDAWLQRHPEANLRDVAHTLAFGRHAFPCRAVAFADTLSAVDAPVDKAKGAAFLFTGMGTQKPGMSRALYENAPAFRSVFDECAAILQPLLGHDIRSFLLAAQDDVRVEALLNEHRIGQPTVFALEYASARMWMDLGIMPNTLIGHSLGEWVAATVAGVFNLADALRLVTLRGGLMDSMQKGAMLAVNLTESEVAARLPQTLDIATVNALDQIVVAGPAGEVEPFARQIEREGIRCKRLQVTLAAHSSLMEPMLPEFRSAIEGTLRHSPTPSLRVISNITGQYLEPEKLQSPDYWTEHLRRAVRFADGLATLWADAGLALVECGPSHTLTNIALRDPRRPEGRVIVATQDGGDATVDAEYRRLLESAGTLWAAGLPVDLSKLFDMQGKGRRIHLPGYAFEKKRHWLDAVPMTPGSATEATPLPLPEEDEDAADTPENASPAERKIIALMRELLGRTRLNRTSDFFLCGGDSLLAVRLASRIGEVFGTQPGRAQIIKARTVEKIAALVQQDGSSSATADRADTCLVQLAQGDERLAPIVLIHAVGGGAFIYGDLLQALRTNRPVWGLQSPGLWDDEPPVSGLCEQAARYHAALKAAGITKPALLGGSSYGGIVAYEMDALLRKEGYTGTLVTMFDSPGPGHMPRPLTDVEAFAYLMIRGDYDAGYTQALSCMNATTPEGRTELLLQRMRETLMPDATMDDLTRQLAVFRANLANMQSWQPTPSAPRILYFKAKEGAKILAQAPELGWVPLAESGIEILPSPGNHSTMLDAPNVSFIANAINHRLS
jgi:amino acid adenylation domain-containing protein